MNIKEIVNENDVYTCINAYNTLCIENQYIDDIIYDKEEILSQYAEKIIYGENAIADLEDVITEFICLSKPAYQIDEFYYTFNGYGNLIAIEEEEIKEYLVEMLTMTIEEEELEETLEELSLI